MNEYDIERPKPGNYLSGSLGRWSARRGLGIFLAFSAAFGIFSAYVFCPVIFYYAVLTAIACLCILKVDKINSRTVLAFFGVAGLLVPIQAMVSFVVDRSFGYSGDWAGVVNVWPYLSRLGIISLGYLFLLTISNERRGELARWMRGGSDASQLWRSGTIGIVVLLAFVPIGRGLALGGDFGIISEYGSSSPYLPPTDENVIKLVEEEWNRTAADNGDAPVDWSSVPIYVEPISDERWKETPADDNDRSHWFDATFQIGTATYSEVANPWSQEVYQGSLDFTISP